MSLIWIRYHRLFCLAALTLASLVAADYAIDNANTSVLYSVAPNGSGVTWRTYGVGIGDLIFETNGTNVTVDASKCYDENYALASCVTDDACQIEFPFTGSGVTIYILDAGFQGVTASFTVDDGQAVTTTIPPPNPPSYQTPNVSLFSIQSLSYGSHNAKISVLDWNNQATSFYFDYALINGSYVEIPVPTSSAPATTPPPTTTTTRTTSSTSSTSTTTSSSSSLPNNPTTAVPSTITTSTSTTPTTSSTLPGNTIANLTSATPSSTPTTQNNDSVNLGLIIGSACAGAVASALLLATIFYFRKRKSKFQKAEDARVPTPFPPLLAPPPPSASVSTHATASPSPPPQMSDKARLRYLHHGATVRQSRAPFIDVECDSGDFEFPGATPATGGSGTGAGVNVGANAQGAYHCAHESASAISRTSTQETLTEGMIVNLTREAAVAPLLVGSFATGSTSPSSAVPPSYQTR